jgi:predicted nucleotidyltransferase
MLIIKTYGLADKLRDALQAIAKKIKVAFIYGSFAKGIEDAYSDVDLLVVGEATLGEIIDITHEVERNLGREINPLVYSPKELKRKMKDGRSFVKSVTGGEKIFIKGTDDELKKIIG